MHPILGHPARRRAFLVVWPCVGAAIGLGSLWWAGRGLDDWWAAVIWGEALGVPVLASAYVCRFAPITTAGAPRVFGTIGASALLTSALWVQAGWIWFRSLSWLGLTSSATFAPMITPALVLSSLVFVGTCAIDYTVAAGDERQLAVNRALEAEIVARDAELRALRAQVDPHFLFNCLHSIGALVGRDPEGARWMCLELAAFFRESLRAGSQARVPLGTEAALIRRYFEIERRRFGDRLRATVVVAPDAEQALVPPLLLQPLAENAVRHGISTLLEGGDITVRIGRQGHRIEIDVDNPYDADARQPGTGIGLANVRERLEAAYGGRASIHVDATAGRFHATLSLPVEEAS